MNHSFDYQDFAEPEPSLSDHRDLMRWTKWNAWFRRKTNFEHSRGHGHARIVGESVIYDHQLRSQATRRERDRFARQWVLVGMVNDMKRDAWKPVPDPVGAAISRMIEREQCHAS